MNSPASYFQTITPQGYAIEETLWDESSARQLANDGETLCKVTSARKHGTLVLNTWARSEAVGQGYLMFPM